nr:immunoglobulin light chain junction region [Macaca mulatta]MOX31277.1 immunoglobulin light chain junction region [Macaca mulatta]MOX31763.1 immunoglobulin light chain junction region [Macaca mulatta]MOX32013.1 immunoglobulin light chain junction region [Macaca mulatta]MOX32075.1 immunoglobulin light chain junction region [Macaca mulatta]
DYYCCSYTPNTILLF